MKPSTRTAFALLVAATMLAAPMMAMARPQAQPGVDYEKARAIYNLAMKHYDSGKLEMACPLFAESLQLAAKSGTAFWLGQCLEKTGQPLAAYRAFSRASDLAKAAGKDKKAAFAEKRAAQLRPKINLIALTIPDEVAALSGLVISLDGDTIPRQRWRQQQPVAPGKHRIEARAPGKQPLQIDIEIEGQGRSEEVALTALEAQPGGEQQPDPQPDIEGGDLSPIAIGGWVMGAAGLAAIGGGVALGFVAKGQYDDAAGDCNEQNQCNQSGFDTRNDARTMGTIGTIVTAGGGALAAAGLLMILLAPDDSSDGDAPSAAAQLARGLRLSAGPHGAAASLTLPLAW